MKSVGSISLGTAVMCLGLFTALAAQQPAPTAPPSAPTRIAATKPAVSHQAAAPANPSSRNARWRRSNALVKRYCVGCHNDRNKDRAGSLTLASFDIAKAGEEADVAERMIRKLQASMMPPPGMPRPDAADLSEFHPRARDVG